MLKPLILQETFPISPTDPEAVLQVYAVPGGEKRPAMLVFPGGGMMYLADTEAEPIARYYAAHGYQPFVVRYSVGPVHGKYPALLQEVSRAVWHVRSNAERYGVDPDRIVCCGFSAGAHVITMFATHYHLPMSREHTDVPEGGNAISATVTGYTPTTMETLVDDIKKLPPESQARWEEGIRNRTLGGWAMLDEPGTFFGELSSLTSHAAVNEATPPAFLWQTTTDLPSNSWEYAMALKRFGKLYELHYFSDPQRCLSMNFDPELYEDPKKVEVNSATWPEMSLHWLDLILGKN